MSTEEHNKKWNSPAATDSKNMCILPWVHLHPWPSGKTLLCCESPYDTSIGDLRTHTLPEVWNSPDMRRVRVNMLADKPSPECVRCYEKEKNGIESLRLISNSNWLKKHQDKVLATKPDGTLDEMHIVYLDFRFSNVCNLRCRYCGPELSSNWFADAVKSSFNQTPTESVIQIRKDVGGFMDELDAMLPYIEQIYWAGGEPLIMDEHWAIMNRLVELGKTDIRIFYNTNFTKLKYKQHDVLDLWKNFKHICVGASLDAEGTRAEYQRKGTVWRDIEENIQRLRADAPDIDFYVSATVSAYNAWHVTDFHRSWVQKGYIRAGDWHVNVLLNNLRFRVSVLPESFRKEIKYKWEKHLKWLEPLDHIGRATKGYRGAIKFLEDDHTHLFDEFKRFNVEFDQLRGENFAETFPELADL